MYITVLWADINIEVYKIILSKKIIIFKEDPLKSFSCQEAERFFTSLFRYNFLWARL